MVAASDLIASPTSSNPYITALTGEQIFRPGYTITYVLQGNPGDAGVLGGALWAAQGAAQAFELAAQAWEAVANVTINAVPVAYTGGNRAAYTWVEELGSLGDDNILGAHDFPGVGDLGGGFNNGHPVFTTANNAVGGYSFLTFLHEIGHGLGLTHPHEPGHSFPGVDGSDDLGDNGLNQTLYTVMSYNDSDPQWTSSNAVGWSATPMAFDIAAIQHLYGANMSTATGDNIYLIPTLSGPNAYWSTIWDAGGIDTISAVGISQHLTIDLRAATLLNAPGGGGYASSLGDDLPGYFIANGVTIENATGGSGHNTLIGNSADNILDGSAGSANDFEGGEGNDILLGGVNTDTATYQSATHGVQVDLRLTTPQNTGQGIDTLVSIEWLNGSSFDDVLIGNGAVNVFDGGAGNDWLAGGDGNDSYYVNSINDVIFENPDEGGDNVVTTSNFYLYANVEGLHMTTDAGDIFGVGNDLNNSIDGSWGNNLLIGLGGDDNISGDQGNDAIYGGEGDDYLTGGEGIDYLFGGFGNDGLYGQGGADALYGEDGDDALVGGVGFVSDILVGGNGDDTLDGASGWNEQDFLDGGAGDDFYEVDTTWDLTFELEDGGIDTVYAVIDVPNAGVYLWGNVENLFLGGQTAYGVGNALANEITGSEYANWLLGGAGNDTIDGGRGDDVLFGEAGSDVFVFGQHSGGDVIGDFNAAEDKIDLDYYNFASFAQLQTAFVQNGAHGAINLGGGNFIVLHNVTMASLDAGDFIL